MELENVVEIEVEMQEAGPKGDKGLSAYEVYLKNGGTLSETEWLDSLKGETGKDGADGKTPIKGTDYWTVQEQDEIKADLQNYVNEQLGVIEDAYY